MLNLTHQAALLQIFLLLLLYSSSPSSSCFLPILWGEGRLARSLSTVDGAGSERWVKCHTYALRLGSESNDRQLKEVEGLIEAAAMMSAVEAAGILVLVL